ncbi:MAG: class I SAM-dependent methyltransferase, partial [Chloroflexi bacterium]|nr:class I SAM-dependent methyltransferase [Chloroflexota bacterium]
MVAYSFGVEDHPELDPQISAYYARGEERERVSTEHALEGVRTRDILDRFLTPLPAVVLDIGGGAGAYAIPLVEKGYKVHLVDPVAMHVRQAAEAATASGVSLASAVVGDARRLAFPDAAADVVLLLGPLYHLTELEDRLGGLKEAHRVLKPGGMLVAAFISRFAAMYDGFFSGKLLQDEFESIMVRDT